MENRHIRLVNGYVAAWLFELQKRLTDTGGLPCLTRPEDCDDPAGRFAKAAEQRADLGAVKQIHSGTVSL